MKPLSPDSREAKFVEYLRGFAKTENRGALAVLRRGISLDRSAAVGICRYVAGWIREEDGRWDEQRFYLVAALFGRYPCTALTAHNFGGSYRQFCIKRESVSESLERRFTALLACDTESVGVHLRHAISLFAAEEIAVNWAELLSDLRWWGDPDRRVQRRWAREFWNRAPVEAAEPGETQGQPEEDEVTL